MMIETFQTTTDRRRRSLSFQCQEEIPYRSTLSQNLPLAFARSRRRKRRLTNSRSTPTLQTILVSLYLIVCEHRQIAIDAFGILIPCKRKEYTSVGQLFPRTCPLRKSQIVQLWDNSNGAVTVSTDDWQFQVISPNPMNGFVNGNVNHHPISSSTLPPIILPQQQIQQQQPQNHSLDVPDDDDIPRPTANGGYTHTTSSRAKISAANKGRTPWNKGKPRSEKVRARIAAGVIARNRERLLQKLTDMGMTEEEYEAQKKEEKRKREQERRARRTKNGGYIPTEETRAKISKALKEKYSSGEGRKRQIDPANVRRGFTHSEETRRKISESLKKKWKDDVQYREHMTQSYVKAHSKKETRKKISEALKNKWQDPTFRDSMVKNMSSRKSRDYSSPSYRKRISEAMTKKWQDPEYRAKNMSSIPKKTTTANITHHRSKKKVVKPKRKEIVLELVAPVTAKERPVRNLKNSASSVTLVSPVEPRTSSASASTVDSEPRSRKLSEVDNFENSPKITSVIENSSVKINEVIAPKLPQDKVAPKAKRKKVKKTEKKQSDAEYGSITRLKKERRDLFDLLYGDDEALFMDDPDINQTGDLPLSRDDTLLSRMGMLLDDEDLDAFDPYGLDDY